MTALVDIRSTWYSQGAAYNATPAVHEMLMIIARDIQARAKKVLIAQGHSITGSLYTDTLHEVYSSLDSHMLEGFYRHYGKYVHYGVKANRIPYRPGSGAKHSLYIEALEQFAKAKGMDNPLGAAFAIARTHKKYGMPSPGSKVYSKTGQRTGWMDEIIDKQFILQVLRENFFQLNMLAIRTMVDNERKKLK